MRQQKLQIVCREAVEKPVSGMGVRHAHAPRQVGGSTAHLSAGHIPKIGGR
jgi:hypothetical protein